MLGLDIVYFQNLKKNSGVSVFKTYFIAEEYVYIIYIDSTNQERKARNRRNIKLGKYKDKKRELEKKKD